MLRFLILLAAPLWAALQFREHTIATDLKGGYQVVAADMNKDGRPDLIALASGLPELVWFENPTWDRHVIAGGFHRLINLAARDTDGDGIPEIVVASEFSNQARNSLGIVSLLVHAGDPRRPWSVKEIDRLTTSHRIRWSDLAGGIFVNAPLTGAGAEPPEFRGRTPLVFYRPGVWKREWIGEENEGVMHGLYVQPDAILTAAMNGLHRYRWKGEWTHELLHGGAPEPWPKSGASDIAAGAGLLATIEPWHGHQVVTYRGGRRQVIDDSLVDGHTIHAADLDGDGRDEIVAGYRGKGRSVLIYYPSGDGWRRETLDNGGMAAAACEVADLNADRRPDIACIGSASANLKWYENRGERPWARHVIDNSSRGADGVRLLGGLLATPWEEGGLIRLYRREDGRWPATTVGQVRSPEDAMLFDVDGDGTLEVISSCEGEERAIYVHWLGGRTEPLPAARGRMQWMFTAPMQVDGKRGVDLVAGGKNAGAQIGWFESPPNPRNLAAWKWHPLAPAGWIMSILPADMDGDGDRDILYSDRKGPARGVWWLENPGWRRHAAGGQGREVMFLDLAGGDIFAAAKPRDILRLRRGNTAVIPIPETAGTAKAVRAGDIDGDGQVDLVFTCEDAHGEKSGVMWLRAPDWSAHEISGREGTKFDLVELVDMDGDGDLDALTCEETENLGVIWYENPRGR